MEMKLKYFIILLCWFVSSTIAKEGPVKVLFMGNWADPTVVKADGLYYLTSNNDHHVPSVLVFKSKDLKTWNPISYASMNEPQSPATDITFYDRKLYIYGGGGNGAWVMYSDYPYETWSPRINMKPVKSHGIDAGHIADEKGNRYIFTNQGKIVNLSPDGLQALTAPKKVYDPWPIPEHIAIECVCLESPKLFKRNQWYYMVSAQGGTAGPATSHMAVVARAKHPSGPWEDSPYNPLIWTEDSTEQWWSKGHATLIEGPDSNWYAIYHGYPNGQRSLGRCTLISPIKWQEDGWPVLAERWPVGWQDDPVVSMPVSDSFEGKELGLQWQSLGKLDRSRYTLKKGNLEVKALGDELPQSYPLTVNPRHLTYEVETKLTIEGDVAAGLVLYYNSQAYVSVALDSRGNVFKQIKKNQSGPFSRSRDKARHSDKSIRLKLRNNMQDVCFWYMNWENEWIKFEQSEDISPFQHNLYGGFVSVRPGIFVTGDGKASFEYFDYRGW